jgi:hypothetical protein
MIALMAIPATQGIAIAKSPARIRRTLIPTDHAADLSRLTVEFVVMLFSLSLPTNCEA